MTKQELLERLWVETAALAALTFPENHRGQTACGCSTCRVAGTLKVLDTEFGMDLAKAANANLLTLRAQVAKKAARG